MMMAAARGTKRRPSCRGLWVEDCQDQNRKPAAMRRGVNCLGTEAVLQRQLLHGHSTLE